ncbi:MAG: hypothetical protein WDN23_12050 [Edaphobacter sp.]
MHVALLEELHDILRAVFAAVLLVVSEGEENGAGGSVATADERLGGFEEGEDVDLVVEGAASPDGAFGDVAGVGTVLPLGEGFGGGGTTSMWPMRTTGLRLGCGLSR